MRREREMGRLGEKRFRGRKQNETERKDWRWVMGTAMMRKWKQHIKDS